jgi:hypothetical protein
VSVPDGPDAVEDTDGFVLDSDCDDVTSVVDEGEAVGDGVKVAVFVGLFVGVTVFCGGAVTVAVSVGETVDDNDAVRVEPIDSDAVRAGVTFRGCVRERARLVAVRERRRFASFEALWL